LSEEYLSTDLKITCSLWFVHLSFFLLW